MELLLFCIAGIAAIPSLRGEKLRLMILRNQIEASAAPDEPILINDWFLNRALQSKGSPALKRQLIYIRDGHLSQDLLSLPEEKIVVARAGDPLLGELQNRGFILSPNITQSAWVDAGKGFHTPGHGVFRIYFAMHVLAQPTAAAANGATP